jgi:hypothetical protein
MAQASRIGGWTKAPNGSTFRIRVASADAGFVVPTAFVVRGNGAEQSIPGVDLHPGPAEIPLEFPHDYSVFLDVFFQKATTAEVIAEVISPNGNVIPQDGTPPESFHTTVHGDGSTKGFAFIVSTGPA